MPTNVVMPQMGESIAEGTIVRWIKKVGDPIDKDEPLFEISNSGSSLSMVSPTFLIQRTIVPSAIDSPICGITTSVGIGAYKCIAAPCAACAASPTASAIVGCA